MTSDSLAVLAAGAIGAEEVVLLKPVDGVLARWPSDDPPVPVLTAAELEELQARRRRAGSGRLPVGGGAAYGRGRRGPATYVRLAPSASARGSSRVDNAADAELGDRRRH